MKKTGDDILLPSDTSAECHVPSETLATPTFSAVSIAGHINGTQNYILRALWSYQF